jgi:hypothetical protein
LSLAAIQGTDVLVFTVVMTTPKGKGTTQEERIEGTLVVCCKPPNHSFDNISSRYMGPLTPS